MYAVTGSFYLLFTLWKVYQDISRLTNVEVTIKKTKQKKKQRQAKSLETSHARTNLDILESNIRLAIIQQQKQGQAFLAKKQLKWLKEHDQWQDTKKGNINLCAIIL